MSKRPAHFKFVRDKKVEVSDRRLLAHMSLKQVRDSLALCNLAHRHIQAAHNAFERMHDTDERLMRLDALTDHEAVTDAQAVRAAIRTSLKSISASIEGLRRAKLKFVTEVEQDFDPIFFQPKPKPIVKRDLAKEIEKSGEEDQRKHEVEEVQMLMNPMGVQVVHTDPTPSPVTSVIPTERKLQLPPDLMEQARQELSRRMQEEPEN